MTRPRAAALAAVLALALPAGAQAAEQFAGITSDNQVVLFRSDSPGNLQGAAPIAGLQANETIVAIDQLPTTGRVYALGSSNRVYLLNVVTGTAAPISNTPFSPPLNGQSFTFAIDPTTFEARVVSNTGQDLRVSVANGQVTGVDAPFSYAAGDPGAGTTPTIAAFAYTLPGGVAGTASLYGVETARDVLVASATGAATVRTLGPLGVDVTEPASLDISASGAAYAVLRTAGTDRPALYTVDVSTGAATRATERPEIAYRTSSTATQDTPVISATSLGAAPDDQAEPRVSISVSSSQLVSRLLEGGLQLTVACSEACSNTATLTVGRNNRQEPVEGAVLATAGNARLRIRLNREARQAFRENPTTGMRLRVVTTDAAGHSTTNTRQIRGRAG